MQNVDWVMGDTPQTVTTTRAPAVLKTDWSQYALRAFQNISRLSINDPQQIPSHHMHLTPLHISDAKNESFLALETVV